MSSCTCTSTRLLLQLLLVIPILFLGQGMAHEAAPGRALPPYLFTQGANEPFQVLLLVQHHLLLLVLLLQLHLQLPELHGRKTQPRSVPGHPSRCQQGRATATVGVWHSPGEGVHRGLCSQPWGPGLGHGPWSISDPRQCQCRREEALQGLAGHWGQDGLFEAHPDMPLQLWNSCLHPLTSWP